MLSASLLGTGALRDRMTGTSYRQAPASSVHQGDRQTAWKWKGRIERGSVLEVRGVTADIHAEGSAGNEAEVVASVRGQPATIRATTLQVSRHSEGVTICVMRLGPDEKAPVACPRGGASRMEAREDDVQVEFRIKVPRGVGFIGRSVIGGVSGFGIEGDMAAYSVTGDIDVAAMSVTEATTVNGSIHAAVGRVDWRGSISFVTVNGDITLDFPAELSAELDLATLNGHIASDYPILVDGRISPRRLRGVVGAGGRGVIAKTVNGNIVVRRL